MPKGGKRPGAGRPRGSRAKADIAKQLAASGITPLDFFLEILRDEDSPDADRMWAAVHAAPYCHPKLNAIDHSGAMSLAMTHEEWLDELERLDKEEASR